MPRFAYEARDAAGRTVRGFEEAVDELALDRRLEEMRLVVVRARQEAVGASRRVPTKVLIDFFYQVAIVIEAGIPLLEGLSEIAEDRSHPLSRVSGAVSQRIASGSSFSAALAEHPKVFPRLALALIGAGERTGNLDRVLVDLVHYLEWREDLRKQVIGALTYPVAALLAIAGLCVIITTVVLPKFMDIFREMGVDLPLTTRALMATSDFMGAYGLHLLFGIAGLVGCVLLFLRTERGTWLFHGLKLRLPLLGKLHLMTEMSRFAHNLGLLYASGISIVEALRMVEEVLTNVRLRKLIHSAGEAVSHGESLTDSIDRGGLLPPLVVRMLRMGEISGRLDSSLERASTFYDREVPSIIKKVLGLFNLLMLLVLAAVLLTVAFSIFVPFYEMMGEISG